MELRPTLEAPTDLLPRYLQEDDLAGVALDCCELKLVPFPEPPGPNDSLASTPNSALYLRHKEAEKHYRQIVGCNGVVKCGKRRNEEPSNSGRLAVNQSSVVVGVSGRRDGWPPPFGFLHYPYIQVFGYFFFFTSSIEGNIFIRGDTKNK